MTYDTVTAMRDETSFLPMPRSDVHRGRISVPTGGGIPAETTALHASVIGGVGDRAKPVYLSWRGEDRTVLAGS